jgi:type I restriction enzyme S subunit
MVQRYKRYIDSGVEWLGEVPEHWDLTRLGTRFEQRKTKVSDKDFPPLSVTKIGAIPQLASAAKSNDGDNRKLVKKGDFVINSRSDRKGSSGIAYQDGSVSLIYIVMEPLNINPIYCNYLLKSFNFIEEFYRMGHGIVADLWTTHYDEMKAIMVGIPPLSEQTAIAQFLYDKTSKIEGAIAIKEQQINLLKERKQILIHKAVTRGLDDAVKLKDSGVEWIGAIPDHWKESKLGYYIDILSGFSFPSNGFSEEGIKLLRGINVGINKIRWEETVFWPINKSKYLTPFYLKKGDLVFGMDRPLISGGMRVSVIKENDLPCLLLQRVTRLRAINGLKQDYLRLILQSQDFVNYFLPILSGVSVPHMSPSQIQGFKIGLPNEIEQELILNHVKITSKKIESAVSLKQQEIAKLKEYKSSLINSVVTGKVKVC